MIPVYCYNQKTTNARHEKQGIIIGLKKTASLQSMTWGQYTQDLIFWLTFAYLITLIVKIPSPLEMSTFRDIFATTSLHVLTHAWARLELQSRASGHVQSVNLCLSAFFAWHKRRFLFQIQLHNHRSSVTKMWNNQSIRCKTFSLTMNFFCLKEIK